MTSVFNVKNLKIVLGVIRDRGWLNVLRLIYHDFMFDIKYRTDTVNVVTMDDMDVNSENKKYGSIYQGVPTVMFRGLLAHMELDFRQSTFIDFGSGKGKALLLASQAGFGNVIGVEYSPELVEISKKNIEIYRDRTGSVTNFTVVRSDAAEYEIPPNSNCMFFYNPFAEPVLKSVLARIDRSFAESPRDIWILYVNPQLSTFKDHPQFEVIKKDRDWWHIYRLSDKPVNNI